MWNGNDAIATCPIITGKLVKLGNISNVAPSTTLFFKYLENLERIPILVSEKPPTCHNGDTMCRTKNRIPKCTSQTMTKFITKFSALTIKRSGQDTCYGARMQKISIKALILVLGLLQVVVGTVKTDNKPWLHIYISMLGLVEKGC